MSKAVLLVLVVANIATFVIGYYLGHNVCFEKDGQPCYRQLTLSGLQEVVEPVEGPVHFIPPHYADKVLR